MKTIKAIRPDQTTRTLSGDERQAADRELRGLEKEATALKALRAGGYTHVQSGRSRAIDLENAIFLAEWYGRGVGASVLRDLETGNYVTIECA